MAKKGIISAVAGVGAGLLAVTAYYVAQRSGYHISPATWTTLAAGTALCASVSVLTLTALTQPEKKRKPAQTRLSELGENDFQHFPKHGLKIVLKPDTVVEELDAWRQPDNYAQKDIFLVFKRGKGTFNPIKINELFLKINFPNLLHILMVDEHDEYLAYIPGFEARSRMAKAGTESLIAQHIVKAMSTPYGESIKLHEINGLSIEDTIFDHETVADALVRVAQGYRGFVVFRGKSLRRPVGVIWASELVQQNICAC